MALLPDPPDSLPEAPRAFYVALREAVGDRAIEAEVDFGDSGLGLTFPTPEQTVAAQVSRRAAVVFAGPEVEHFDERTPGWTDAAAAAVARALSD